MKTSAKSKSYVSYALLYFSYFFGMGIFGSILSIYLAGIGKADSEISLIVSASGILTMALQPVFGIVYDKLRRDRTVSVVLLLLSGVTGVLFAVTKSTPLLFLFNGLSMTFLNGVNPVAERLATGAKYRYGLIRLWGAVGYAVSTQTAGFVYEHISPRFNFWLFGAAALITALAFVLTTDNAARTDISEGKPEPRGGSILRTLARNRPYLLFAAISFLFSGSASANGTYLSLLLGDLLGSTSQVGTVLFLGTMMEIPIILFSNRYMDCLSGKALLRVDFALLIIQFAVYAFVPNAAAVSAVLFFCKSTATMLYIMVTLKIVLNLVDERCSATALSIVATVKAVGGVVIPIAAGFVSDAFGRPAVFVLLLGFAVLGFALSAFLRMPENSKKLF